MALLVCAGCSLGQMAEDTATMRAHSGQFRGRGPYQMGADEYAEDQNEFAGWIDARLRAGLSIARMNEELEAAGLFDSRTTGSTEAGFLTRISEEPTDSTDLRGIKFGIQTGPCNRDETVLLYAIKPFTQVAKINGERFDAQGYWLRELRAGSGPDRLIASEWTPSRCASNWSNDIFRVDRLTLRGDISNVFDKRRDVFGSDNAKVEVDRDTATFEYTIVGKADSFWPTIVSRLRISEGKVIREAPIATSYGGFIEEWIGMGDAEAALWSSSQAAGLHHVLANRLEEQSFDWKAAADCGDFPPIREIEIQASNSGETTVFVLDGATIETMGILAISDHLTPTCRRLDINADPSPITEAPKQ